MKIIKEGKIGTTRRFNCERCGCIWEAKKGEYEPTPPVGDLKFYWMKCPTCGKYVDVD